ncbi:tetratricopeptide repeat protein [Sphingomonas sp. AX6]|uniref:tetratricopeptide repeat protein n=1 Tax=Sphingomonas sp. AX6 TaxID=2653171 RepID=UPI0012F171D2|nr:tetratricopeptide repeat protein [Sphingomonas sp. AX6]VXC87528.1 conserved exported hypothetical protein [Sphingomonas sp. AX6]
MNLMWGVAFNRLAVVTMVVAGVGGTACSVAATRQQVSAVMEIGGSKIAVSPQEMKALSKLGNLVRSGQSASQERALAEARRVASGRDARYALALYELEIGRRRDDDAMRAQALDVLVASQLTRPDRLPGHLAARGQIAYQTGDFDTAGKHWARLAELTPSDPDVFANLAQVRLAQKDALGAIDLLQRAIVTRKGLGQAAPEGWYRQQLSIAQQASLETPGIDAARTLVTAYPTPANWRAALVVYRELTAPEGALEIDLLRLTRHVNAFAQAAEYQRMAQLLNQSGEPSEAKAVLDEGITRGLLDAGKSPTREIIAEVDRAMSIRSVSPTRSATPDNVGTQIRLGMSELRAGRKAEAEATFRAAATRPGGGPYSDLAFFWLASLTQGQRKSN